MLQLLWPLPVLRLAASVAFVAFLLSAIPRASRHIRWLCAVVALASLWLLARGAEWRGLHRALESALVFGAFMPTIMLLRATADASPLLDAARTRLVAANAGERCLWVQSVAHLLGAFVMVGGYVVARSALPPALPPGERARIAESATRGLGLAVAWSPFFVASAAASQLVPGVAAWKLVAVGALFAALGWALSLALLFPDIAWPARRAALRASFGLAVPAAVLVGCVLVVATLANLRGLDAIVLVVPLVCLAYLATRGGPAARRALGSVPSTLARLSDEVIVVTVAMCFGGLVAGADLGREFAAFARALGDAPFVLIPAELLLIVTAGFVGVHPMISATILLPLLAEAHRGLADVVVAYIVVFGWALSSTIAIWTLPLASSASIFEVPVRRLALGRNLAFVAGYGTLGALLLALLARFIH